MVLSLGDAIAEGLVDHDRPDIFTADRAADAESDLAQLIDTIDQEG